MASFTKRTDPSGRPPSDQVQMASLSRLMAVSNSSTRSRVKPGYFG
jgi:hypothetical protein